ncbi:hypothetical protein EVAR_18553_1 [Eumeta japonica]|uniref:Uncharacterized protein n=1 Tax=Eumeta variegata TaxID=151549 RepID=A0A4C1V4Z0_EUMVA|nr:hypothetical protein EVAR_18553_1 [Eumeta japonica]
MATGRGGGATCFGRRSFDLQSSAMNFQFSSSSVNINTDLEFGPTGYVGVPLTAYAHKNRLRIEIYVQELRTITTEPLEIGRKNDVHLYTPLPQRTSVSCISNEIDEHGSRMRMSVQILPSTDQIADRTVCQLGRQAGIAPVTVLVMRVSWAAMISQPSLVPLEKLI